MAARAMALLALVVLGGCVYRPLYGPGADSAAVGVLPAIAVEEVDTRVAQQVRNRLIFLLQGGQGQAEAVYALELRVTPVTREFAATQRTQDNTAGTVTVTVSYTLLTVDGERRVVASGSRQASASYDRTSQNFANERARRDAEDRAAHEAAELVRAALVADVSRRAGS